MQHVLVALFLTLGRDGFDVEQKQAFFVVGQVLSVGGDDAQKVLALGIQAKQRRCDNKLIGAGVAVIERADPRLHEIRHTVITRV